MNILFPQYHISNELIYNETIKIIEEEPQELIELVRNSIIDVKNLTTTLAYREILFKSNKNFSDKLKCISVYYELASFFRIGSYLLSERKTTSEFLKNPQKIFKGYKMIGVDFNIDKLRLIRNAINHKFSIKGNWLLDNNDKELIEISEIEEIYKSLEECCFWYLNFIINQSYFIPKFGLILLLTCYYEITENKKDYEDYYKGFKLIAPDVFNRKNEVHPPKQADNSFMGKVKSKVNDMLTIRTTAKFRFSKNKYYNKLLYFENLMNIEIQLNRQIDILRMHLIDIQSKLNNSDDIKRITKTLDWINNNRSHWVDLIRQERIKSQNINLD